MVTSLEFEQDVLSINYHYSGGTTIFDDNTWCRYDPNDPDGPYLDPLACDLVSWTKTINSWVIPGISTCQYWSKGSPNVCVAQTQPMSAPIAYCLVETPVSHCTIQLSTTLLAVVVAFNFVKVVCLLSTLLLSNFRPLATTGDEISAFLENPEPLMCDLGPISAAEGVKLVAETGAAGPSVERPGQPWHERRRFWFSAASVTRWTLASLFYVSSISSTYF